MAKYALKPPVVTAFCVQLNWLHLPMDEDLKYHYDHGYLTAPAPNDPEKVVARFYEEGTSPVKLIWAWDYIWFNPETYRFQVMSRHDFEEKYEYLPR